jgi:catechol 2,3-dioxygenase-like lactoylglutathione lyase family enzyme
MTLQHVSLETRPGDVDAELRFWALLGFEPVTPPPSLRARAAWVQRGPTQVHLLFADEPVVWPKGHVAVAAADYESTIDGLRRGGFEPEPRAEHWGSPRSYVRSPGGHLVEVMAWPPDGKCTCP